MRERKWISLFLVGAMLLAMVPALGGCGSTNTSKAVLIVADTFGDASFYDSAKAGAQRLEKDGIASVQYVECKGANYDAKLREAAGSAELVLAVGWKFENIAVIAAEYPDVKFVWADGVLPELPENLICITYAQNEGAFLAGYLAASLSKSEKIGMIGGNKSDIIGEFLAGYQQGAAYANPSCDVQSAFIGSFLDAEAAKSEALTLAENGCDVIFHAAGAAGNGVFEAADEKNFYAIGADSDQKHLDEEHIAASVVKDIGSSLYDLTAAYAKGDWEGGRTWNTNLETGYIGLGYGASGSVQQVSDELKKEIEQIAEKIKSGELVVQTVPEDGGQKIAVIRNLTDDDHTKSFFEGAVEKGEALCYKVETFLTDTDDVLMQKKLTEVIDSGLYAGIIVSHGKEAYSHDLLQKAVDQGIKIVTFDTVSAPIEGVTMTAQDDAALARLSLDALIFEADGQPARLIKVWYDEDLAPFAKRNAVYKEYEAAGKIETVAEIYPVVTSDKLRGAVKDEIIALGDFKADGIWAAWDELAKGVYDGLQEMRKADVPMVSIDLSSDDRTMMQESPALWTASAYVDAKVIGETCMELLGQKLSGEITPAQYTFDALLKKASNLK